MKNEIAVKVKNSRKLLLIGIAGKAHCGKDTIGDYLIKNHNFQTYSFAMPIKKAICEMFGLQMSIFEDPETKEKIIPFWGYSPRQMAQLLGTEGGRDLFDANIWVRRAHIEWCALIKSAITLKKISQSLETAIRGMAITDVRFENEAAWIRNQGGKIWHIKRDVAAKVSDHVSENGIEPVAGDLGIANDGTISELYENVDVALAKMLLRD